MVRVPKPLWPSKKKLYHPVMFLGQPCIFVDTLWHEGLCDILWDPSMSRIFGVAVYLSLLTEFDSEGVAWREN